MTAGASACHCEVCGYECHGLFGGCSDVWARGPVEVQVAVPTRDPQSRRATVDLTTVAPAAPRARDDHGSLGRTIEQLQGDVIALRFQVERLQSELEEVRAVRTELQHLRALVIRGRTPSTNGHAAEKPRVADTTRRAPATRLPGPTRLPETNGHTPAVTNGHVETNGHAPTPTPPATNGSTAALAPTPRVKGQRVHSQAKKESTARRILDVAQWRTRGGS